MNYARGTLSLLSVLVLALVAALPWGGGDAVRVALPLLPMAGVVYWTMHQRSSLPAATVFLSGIVMDILAQAPLGFWALIALLTALFVRALARHNPVSPLPLRGGIAVAALALASALSWALASVYTFERIALQPHLSAMPLAIGGYVLIAAVLSVFDALVSGAQPHTLFGGND